MKKISFLLLLALTLSLVAFAHADIAWNSFPPIEEVTAHNAVNDIYGPNTTEGYLKNKFLGYYTDSLAAGEFSTEIFFYTPENCLIGSPAALVLLDDGQSVEEFLADTAWTDFAELNASALLIVKAPETGWNDDTLVLVAEAAARITPAVNSFQPELTKVFNYYSNAVRTLVGVGSGATEAMNYLLDDANTSGFGSALLINPKDYVYEAYRATSTYGCAITLITADETADESAFVEFFANNTPDFAPVVLGQDDAIPFERVTAFRRNGKGLQAFLPIRDKDAADYCGLSRETVISNGILRYYMLYVPASVRESEEKVPVVIACHGKTAIFSDYVYSSGWMNIANSENIIVAFPIASPDINVAVTGVYTSCAWGRWDDTDFLQTALVNELLASEKADPSRIYVYGHSSGCCMSIGQAVSSGANGNPFAAVSGTGGWLGFWEPLGFATEETSYDVDGTPFTPRDDDGDGVYNTYEKNPRFDAALAVPTQIQYGVNDHVMHWAQLKPEGGMVAAGPALDNPGIKRMFNFYNGHYAIADSLRAMLDSAAIYKEDIFSNYIYSNAEGTPMFWYQVVDGLGHVQNEQEAREALRFFLSYARNEDGTIVYTGEISESQNTDGLFDIEKVYIK